MITVLHPWHKLAVAIFILSLLLGGGWLCYTWLHKPIVPTNIRSQLNFGAYIPPERIANFVLDRSSFKYDSINEIFSFVVRSPSKQVTFTEQPYPDILVYDKLVGTLGQYDEIQTKIGKVALGRPIQLQGSQAAAVDVNNQTLIFAEPTSDLTSSQWSQLFNNLQVVQ